MSDAAEEFRLSPEEFGYLKGLLSQGDLRDFAPRLEGVIPSGNVSVRLSRAEAERIRDYLTTQLARVGFDEHYQPNKEGRLIEELIDKFYVP